MPAAPIDRILRWTLVAVVIADVILFLNVTRPEGLTAISYDPFATVWRQWLLVAAIVLAAVLIARVSARRRRARR